MATTKKPPVNFFLVVAIIFILSVPFVSANTGLETGIVKLEMFLIISGLAALFFFLALTSEDGSLFGLIACVLLFIMGFILNAGNLHLPSGETTYNYAEDNTTLLSEGKVLEAWDGNNSHLIGWLLMIVSGIFFSLTLYNLSTGEY